MDNTNHFFLPIIIIIILPSCLISSDNSPRRKVNYEVKQNNFIQISSLKTGPQIIDESDKGLVPKQANSAIITFRDPETGDTQQRTSIQQGVPTEVSDLPDGKYEIIVDVKEEGIIPPKPKIITVENGQFENIDLELEKVQKDYFYYRWESNNEGYEYEYSANDDISDTIEFLDESVEIFNSTASLELKEKYNIILSDEKIEWTYDLSSKLLKSVNSIPHDKLNNSVKFILTEEHINNGIEFTKDDNQYTATLSLEVFKNSSEKLVKLNGKRGRYFSLELFKALIYFFTDNGNDTSAVAKILDEKFSVTTNIPDYNELTGEHYDRFQDFHSIELVRIILAFAEMPTGYYKIPGLRYLVRRKDGHPHPLYPTAPAVAWPRGSNRDSYIEFMDTAFTSGSEDYIHRLILHEKSHFLWRNVFSDDLKNDWIELGQWFENSEASSGWSTYDNIHFVSAYAHEKNPNEDMAESLSFYVLNPNKLLSVASNKFDFIEKRIMNGYRYVSSIRDDLTFEVLNLFPDYDYPGKIKKVEVEVKGDELQDKSVSITIELTDKEDIEDGASHAYTRVFSPNDNFKDVYLYPVNGNNHKLQGVFSVPKEAKRGYWNINNISISDSVGNERHEGIVDFGFKMYINNAHDDTIPPKYVPDSLVLTYEEEEKDDRQIFNLNVSWNVNENGKMAPHSPVYANLISLDHNDRYRITGYGRYDKNEKKAYVDLILTEFFPPGRYGISYINMKDRALNIGKQYFSDDPKHEPIKHITIDPRDPDFKKPVLDVNRITVQASPVNPSSPDGSTNVEINFYAKDDKAGLDVVSYKLMDPLGKVHFNYFYHADFYTLFYSNGDPAVYKLYKIKTTLPKGSPPGRWGILEIVLHDKAKNINTYNFLETMHFRLE